MTRQINRSNLYDLRKQINDGVMQYPEVRNSIDDDVLVEVPDGFQMIVYKSFTVNGKLQLDGQLVII